eukprot:13436-Heterococcus_DN1.PRE.4
MAAVASSSSDTQGQKNKATGDWVDKDDLQLSGLKRSKTAVGSNNTRLMKDLQRMMRSDTASLGFSLEPVNEDNMTLWKVKLFGFTDCPLEADMVRLQAEKGMDHIEVEMRFTDDYPYSPPFVRVVFPRFMKSTGFILNGAFCFELLTKQGWTPTNDIESVLIQIRAIMLMGGARIDFDESQPYTETLRNKNSKNYYKKQHVIKIKRVIAPQQSTYNTQQALDTHVHIHTHHRGTLDTATRAHCAATALTPPPPAAVAVAAAVVVQSSVSAVMLLSDKLAVEEAEVPPWEPCEKSGSVWDVGAPTLLKQSTRTMLSRAITRGALRACSSRLQRKPVLQCRQFSAAFTEDELMIKDMVARFSADVIKPRVRAMDDAGCMDPAVITGLFEDGLMGVEVPAEQGGSGLGFTSACLVIEEIAKVDPSVAVMVDIQSVYAADVCSCVLLAYVHTRDCKQNTLLNNMLRFYATPELQSKYFAAMTTSKVASFALSEPGSGSDAFALTTTATLSADKSYYTIEGQKMWISNAEQAEIFFVFATVDRAAGYKGITCFIVDKEFGGIDVGPKEDKLGIRASSTCPVTFTACKVPATNVLGQVGKGYKYAIDILNEGRIGIGAQMVGLSAGCFEHVMPYLYERKQFGTHIGDFQSMQHQFAQVATEIEAARALTYSTARLK